MGNALELPNKDRKLSPKLRKFARFYHKTGNATQSAISAGYSEKSAETNTHRLTNNEGVLAYISQLEDELAEEHKAIFSTVIQRTHDITRKAERGRLVTNSKGEPVKIEGEPVYEPDTANALKGLEQLAKMGGLHSGDSGKLKDIPQWTGIEIDYGDGTLRMIAGTGPMSTQDGQKLNKEGPPKNDLGER